MSSLLLAFPFSPLCSLCAPATVHWVEEPKGRGTFGIVATCVITSCLSAWTSLRLNVPREGEGRARQAIRKVCWMITALLAPEIVAFAAWSQWNSCRKLREEVNRLLDTENASLMKDKASFHVHLRCLPD